MSHRQLSDKEMDHPKGSEKCIDVFADHVQERAGKGKVSSEAVAGVSAVFQQMAGKIVDFPWDAATGDYYVYVQQEFQ